ncbi:MAG: hypothetical protein AAF465_07595 [Pseudomonadota bacterium]
MRHRLVFIGLILLSGCVSVDYPVEEVEKARLGQMVSSDPVVIEQLASIAKLEQMLLSLSPQVDPLEAANIAGSTVNYSLALAEDYELTKQPVLHNVLVNYGLRPRGLCIHFAEDILRMLLAKNLQTFDVYWGVAYPTERFRLEHSSAVVTAKGHPFESGIVLDGWRDSGKLFFVHVPDDDRYSWELFDDKVTQEHRLKKAREAQEALESTTSSE